MPVKDILLHVDRGPTCKARLHLAGELAHRHDARVVALYGLEPSPYSELLFNIDAGYLDVGDLEADSRGV